MHSRKGITIDVLRTRGDNMGRTGDYCGKVRELEYEGEGNYDFTL